MFRIKLILLGLFATLGVSAAVSPLAFAAGYEYFVHGTELAGSQAIKSSVGTVRLRGKISTSNILIECNKNDMTEGKFEEGGKSTGSFRYTGCKLFEIKEGKKTGIVLCTVEIPEFKFKGQLVEGLESGVVQDELKPSSGSIFFEIKITGGSCVLNGTFSVEEGDLASPGDEAEIEIERTEQELVFTSTGCCGSLGTGIRLLWEHRDVVTALVAAGGAIVSHYSRKSPERMIIIPVIPGKFIKIGEKKVFNIYNESSTAETVKSGGIFPTGEGFKIVSGPECLNKKYLSDPKNEKGCEVEIEELLAGHKETFQISPESLPPAKATLES